MFLHINLLVTILRILINLVNLDNKQTYLLNVFNENCQISIKYQSSVFN